MKLLNTLSYTETMVEEFHLGLLEESTEKMYLVSIYTKSHTGNGI